MLEFILGICVGLPIGFIVYYIKQHKSDVSYDINLIQSELSQLHVKLDNIEKSISLPK